MRVFHQNRNTNPCSPIYLSPFFIMTSVTTSLAKALPKPMYTGEHEELPNRSRGPKVIGVGSSEETQVVSAVSSDFSEKPSDLKRRTDSVIAKQPSGIWIKSWVAPKVCGGLRRWRGVSRNPSGSVPSRHGQKFFFFIQRFGCAGRCAG